MMLSISQVLALLQLAQRQAVLLQVQETQAGVHGQVLLLRTCSSMIPSPHLLRGLQVCHAIVLVLQTRLTHGLSKWRSCIHCFLLLSTVVVTADFSLLALGIHFCSTCCG